MTRAHQTMRIRRQSVDLPNSTDSRSMNLNKGCPQIMGILNVTPDSFSDGGQFRQCDAALERALEMVDEGADIIDIGGESTRPGAADVALDEELSRVIPVIEAIARHSDVTLSIDTSKAEVMRQAVSAGAGMINDVRALREPGALDAASESTVPICLMHMQGAPRSMQDEPRYDDVVSDITRFFMDRILDCELSGIDRSRLIIDPGFGFGKTLEHNLELLARLSDFSKLDLPVLIGVSRKSMFGALLDRTVEDRLPASIAAAVMAMQAGASIVRVHDVSAHADARRSADGDRCPALNFPRLRLIPHHRLVYT